MGALIYKALQRHISSRSSAAEWDELLTRVLAALPAGTRPDWANGIGLPELLRFAAEYLDTTPDQLLFDAAAAWVGPADAPPRSDTTAADLLSLAAIRRYSHDVGLAFPFLKPPVLVVERDRQGQVHLQFHCYRGGFTHFIRGILSATARGFDARLDVTLVQEKSAGAAFDDFRLSLREAA